MHKDSTTTGLMRIVYLYVWNEKKRNINIIQYVY